MSVFPGFGGPNRSFWRDVRRDVRPKTSSLGWIFVLILDDRQITHLSCVRLRHLLYDFLGGVLGLLPVISYIKGPKHPLKRSSSKCPGRTQITWVIWRSSNYILGGFQKGGFTILTGIWREIYHCNRGAGYWDSPPFTKPPFGNPWCFFQGLANYCCYTPIWPSKKALSEKGLCNRGGCRISIRCLRHIAL